MTDLLAGERPIPTADADLGRIAAFGDRQRIYVIDLAAETSPWSAATGREIDGFWLQGVVFSDGSR